MQIEGNILGRASTGRTPRARSSFDQAHALYEDGKLEETIAFIEAAIGRGESSPRMLLLQGVAYSRLGRYAEGDARFKEVLKHTPKNVSANRNLMANAFFMQDFRAAIVHGERVVELDPENVDARWKLANAFIMLEGFGKARDQLRAIQAIDPDNLGARFEQLTVGAFLCDWTDFDEIVEEIKTAANEKDPKFLPNPFYVLGMPGMNEELISKVIKGQVGKTPFDGEPFYPLNTRKVPAENRKARGKKLKIGYLSSDFHEHATMYLLADVLTHHDQKKFEIYGFALDKDRKSPMRDLARANMIEFVELFGQSDADIAQAIYDRGIDILVDLKGYTRGARPQAVRRRPAPLVVNFLGYPGTMGLDAVDYIVADDILIPKSSTRFYTERIAYMPVCYQPNVIDRQVVRPKDRESGRAEWGLPNDKFVFASLNQPYKITDDMFDAWMTILDRVPDAVLWLWVRKALPRENLIREARARGIDPDRLIFATTAPPAHHLGRVGLVDVCLDTAPVSSHTTAADALWNAVPLIAMKSPSFAGRVSSSLLNAYGVPELAATTRKKYIDLAVRLATDEKFRSRIDTKMKKNRDRCYLFNSARFTKDLEKLYAKMWAAYETGTMKKVLR